MGKLLWVYDSLFLDDEFVFGVGFATVCKKLALNRFLQFFRSRSDSRRPFTFLHARALIDEF